VVKNGNKKESKMLALSSASFNRKVFQILFYRVHYLCGYDLAELLASEHFAHIIKSNGDTFVYVPLYRAY